MGTNKQPADFGVVIYPIPASVRGVENPVIHLNGNWKFAANSSADADTVNLDHLPDIEVPGEIAMRGFEIAQDREYYYIKTVQVPADFANHKVVLRFDGVYSYAKVWVNGVYIRDHYGGFTSWNCDISDCAVPGQEIRITVGVTDRSDDVSFASGYAFHPIGGILRDVKMMALPKEALIRLYIETDFDECYTDATLILSVSVELRENRSARVQFTLEDPQGMEIPLYPDCADLTHDNPGMRLVIPVEAPRRWDAEHPNLYTLTARLEIADQVVEVVASSVGFRKIETIGNQLCINGKSVKLRGVNRHDIHPQFGRVCPDEWALQDVVLFKDANVNFIRTSHYPPSQAFLDACDRIGMYVEEETAVCWADRFHGPTNGGDPAYSDWYMGQFTEMIERDRNHPSVIIWSLGNESRWNDNFDKEYSYAKATDPVRPCIFSYSKEDLGGKAKFDIFSSHYPDISHELGSSDYPVLHDEYAHIACYNYMEICDNPNVRNFWGESIRRFWEKISLTDGALGGAIWCGIDEIFLIPGKGPVGYGEWGVVDIWRREKPEYWLVKKAYSPISIQDGPLLIPDRDESLMIPVDNRFDHTNLREIIFLWKMGGDSGEIRDVPVGPHCSGLLVIPTRDWKEGEVLRLQCVARNGNVIDEYELPLKMESNRFQTVQEPAPELREGDGFITVSGADFEIDFSRQTGLIERGLYRGTLLIQSGPFLHLDHYCPPLSWHLKELRAYSEEKRAIVRLSGSYGNAADATFVVRVDGSGLITTQYTVDRLSFPLPSGGFREVGISYEIADSLERISWKRRGQWSVYPPDHIGRNEGQAARFANTVGETRQDTHGWAQDKGSIHQSQFFHFTPAETNDFRSSKEYVLYFSAIHPPSNHRIRAEFAEAARVQWTDRVSIDCAHASVTFSGVWKSKAKWIPSYIGPHMFVPERLSNRSGDTATIHFYGRKIRWIGSQNRHLGIVEVYMDGVFDAEIDLYHPEDRMGVLYECEMTAGEHALTIVLTGRKNPASADAFAAVFRFDVYGVSRTGAPQLIILNEFNYPGLLFGNYMKPCLAASQGYQNSLRMRLCNHD